jgi:hypothetical protein
MSLDESENDLVQTRLSADLKAELVRFANAQGTSVAATLRAIVADVLNQGDVSQGRAGDRWKRLMVRFSSTEFDLVQGAADDAGLPAAAWVRWAAKQQLSRPSLDAELARLRARIEQLESR